MYRSIQTWIGQLMSQVMCRNIHDSKWSQVRLHTIHQPQGHQTQLQQMLRQPCMEIHIYIASCFPFWGTCSASLASQGRILMCHVYSSWMQDAGTRINTFCQLMSHAMCRNILKATQEMYLQLFIGCMCSVNAHKTQKTILSAKEPCNMQKHV